MLGILLIVFLKNAFKSWACISFESCRRRGEKNVTRGKNLDRLIFVKEFSKEVE